MKNILLLFFTSFILVACSPSGSGFNSPYLPNQSVYFTLDLNLPGADHLKYPGNVYVTYNYGIRGIAIYNEGGAFYAYELTCSNHEISYCSTLRSNKPNDIYVYCDCTDQHDGKRLAYSLINGQPTSGTDKNRWPLKQYPVSQSRDKTRLEIRY